MASSTSPSSAAGSTWKAGSWSRPIGTTSDGLSAQAVRAHPQVNQYPIRNCHLSQAILSMRLKKNLDFFQPSAILRGTTGDGSVESCQRSNGAGEEEARDQREGPAGTEVLQGPGRPLKTSPGCGHGTRSGRQSEDLF